MQQKQKALFLDRDGIINEDRHYPYVPQDIVFIPSVFDVCKAALAKGYIIIVTTNQAGVAKGYFSEQDVVALHGWMKQQFADRGIAITAFYYCPYHKNGKITPYIRDSEERKPKPGMFLRAIKDWNIDINQSLMIGDKVSDRIELTGLKCFIVKSQYMPQGYDLENLSQAISVL
jgi:D-glycero-D-manno-heptose 1,7-bisphosphate phosphatase